MEKKTNWDLICDNQELFDLAFEEAINYYIVLGAIEDPDDIKLKDVCSYVNCKPFPYQPERSKREDLDCCKRTNKLQELVSSLIDCPPGYNHYMLEFAEELLQESKMRCSEHCGNTVRGISKETLRLVSKSRSQK